MFDSSLMCLSVTLAGQEVVVYPRGNLAYLTLHGDSYQGFCREVNLNFSNSFIFLIFGIDPSHLEARAGCLGVARVPPRYAGHSGARFAAVWQRSRRPELHVYLCLSSGFCRTTWVKIVLVIPTTPVLPEQERVGEALPRMYFSVKIDSQI